MTSTWNSSVTMIWKFVFKILSAAVQIDRFSWKNVRSTVDKFTEHKNRTSEKGNGRKFGQVQRKLWRDHYWTWSTGILLDYNRSYLCHAAVSGRAASECDCEEAYLDFLSFSFFFSQNPQRKERATEKTHFHETFMGIKTEINFGCYRRFDDCNGNRSAKLLLEAPALY